MSRSVFSKLSILYSSANWTDSFTDLASNKKARSVAKAKWPRSRSSFSPLWELSHPHHINSGIQVLYVPLWEWTVRGLLHNRKQPSNFDLDGAPPGTRTQDPLIRVQFCIFVRSRWSSQMLFVAHLLWSLLCLILKNIPQFRSCSVKKCSNSISHSSVIYVPKAPSSIMLGLTPNVIILCRTTRWYFGLF